MSALPLPNGRVQFIDADGAPIVGGQVFSYVPGTITPKSTWQDLGQTILNTNPIQLDDLGSATIFAVGSVRQIVNDLDGNLVWDQVTSNALGTVASIDLSNVDPAAGRAALGVANNGLVLHSMGSSMDVQGAYGRLDGAFPTNRLSAGEIASNCGANFFFRSNRNVTTNDFVNALRSDLVVDGTAQSGGGHGFLGTVQVSSPTSPTNPNRNYVGAAGFGAADTPDGGTGVTAATAKGALFGGSFAAYANTGATNWLNISATEFNVFSYVGSTYAYASAVAAVSGLHHGAAIADAALWIGAQPGLVGWKYGVFFTDYNGADAINATSTLMGAEWSVAGQRTILNGIDLSTFSPTDAYLKGQRMKVTNARITLGSTSDVGYLDVTAGTASLMAGTGSVSVGANGANSFSVSAVSGGDNRLTVVGQAAGAPAFLAAAGPAANINLTLRPKGTGMLDFTAPSTTTATAGAASALPATPQAYLSVVVNGVTYKIPAYLP